MDKHSYSLVVVLFTAATIKKESGTVLADLMLLMAPAIFTVILKNGNGMDKESCVTEKLEICGQESGPKT